MKKYIALLCAVLLLLAALTGCAKSKEEAQPAGSENPVETAEAAEETSVPERQHGDRFEDVITIEGMEETIKLLHQQYPACKTVVGGAVLTGDYAETIGADCYAKDAKATVASAKTVFDGSAD